MLGLVVAPLSGIEFVASPKLTGRVHRRTELSSTLRAPWDVDLENILDNVRLALATKVRANGQDTPTQATSVPQTVLRCRPVGSPCLLAHLHAELSTQVQTGVVRHDVLVNY